MLGRGSERGTETRQGSPVERVSGSYPAPEAYGVLTGHLPMNLTEAGFTSSSEGSSGIPPNHPLCWLSMLLPQGGGRLRSRSCGGLPNTSVGRLLASSAGAAPQQPTGLALGPGALPRGLPQQTRGSGVLCTSLDLSRARPLELRSPLIILYTTFLARIST